jgi:hypothetical protein
MPVLKLIQVRMRISAGRSEHPEGKERHPKQNNCPENLHRDFKRFIGDFLKLRTLRCWGLGHFFAFSPSSTSRRLFKMVLRLRMAGTVRFNSQAITAISIFESSSAKNCASSAGVHARLAGRGPSFILLLPSPELDNAATSAEPIAQREAAAAMSHGMDPLAQSRCYFLFAFSHAFRAIRLALYSGSVAYR